MTSCALSDDSFQPNRTPKHTGIFAQIGSGKSVLVIQKLLDELSKSIQQSED